MPAWERRHPRAWATTRLGGAGILATCGALTLAYGGNDTKTRAWATAFFAGAALSGAAGWGQLRRPTQR